MSEIEKKVPATTKYSAQELLEKFGTKSAAIRYLSSEGLKGYTISQILGIRPQHVYNVLKNPPKKSA